MVTDVQELQDDLVPDVDDDVTDEDQNEPEPTEEEEAPDPLAELKSALDEIRASNSRLEAQVRGELGRAQRVERLFDEFKQTIPDPFSTIDPRLSTNEDALSGLIDALSTSDLLDDQSRNSLRGLQSRLSEARTQRERTQLRTEIMNEVRGAQPASNDDNAALQAAVNNETAQLLGYAAARGVDFSSVPQAELMFREGETIQQASARVRAVIDGLANEDSATTRVASRRRAASASPARASAAMSDEELVEDYGLHPERYEAPDMKAKAFAALERLQNS